MRSKYPYAFTISIQQKWFRFVDSPSGFLKETLKCLIKKKNQILKRAWEVVWDWLKKKKKKKTKLESDDVFFKLRWVQFFSPILDNDKGKLIKSE